MKKVLLLILISFLFACSGKKANRIPDTVLSKEKMAEVLVDVHLMEASMNLNSTPGVIASAQTEVGSDVLKKHNITKKQYDESFNYYARHPELLAEVYQLVLNTLSKMQAESMVNSAASDSIKTSSDSIHKK